MILSPSNVSTQIQTSWTCFTFLLRFSWGKQCGKGIRVWQGFKEGEDLYCDEDPVPPLFFSPFFLIWDTPNPPEMPGWLRNLTAAGTCFCSWLCALFEILLPTSHVVMWTLPSSCLESLGHPDWAAKHACLGMEVGVARSSPLLQTVALKTSSNLSYLSLGKWMLRKINSVTVLVCVCLPGISEGGCSRTSRFPTCCACLLSAIDDNSLLVFQTSSMFFQHPGKKKYAKQCQRYKIAFWLFKSMLGIDHLKNIASGPCWKIQILHIDLQKNMIHKAGILMISHHKSYKSFSINMSLISSNNTNKLGNSSTRVPWEDDLLDL